MIFQNLFVCSTNVTFKTPKILYYCYAEFLKKTGEKLFEEPIVSYKYGPVVESVFNKFTVHGSSVIDYQEDESFIIKPNEVVATPSFIKLSLSEHGLVATECILSVLSEYGQEKPFNLVRKTHKVGGPWQRVYREGFNREITDDLIISYHDIVK
ncbi:Panacea domain-containing protein [Piscibacillus salipiscarius]|uniref:Panacea domain-containing protein n=1 Tax=Piscibacillus salipiscarius TaxID=299480 RepID=UPI002436B470|nr:type II toxin-antitoxin system antitoxin SocA domain-containing protein [Piscibacillus salipiscarius]